MKATTLPFTDRDFRPAGLDARLATQANTQAGSWQAPLLSQETGKWAGEWLGLSPAYQRRGLPLLANANLCGLREADDRGLEGAGHGGRCLPGRALDGAAQHHSRERSAGLRGGRLLLLALLDEGCGVGGQLSQGRQAPLGRKDTALAGGTGTRLHSPKLRHILPWAQFSS